MSVSGVDGYIVYYNGGEAVLIEGQDSTNRMLKGLIKGTTYTIDVYSYKRFYSNVSRGSIAVFFTGKFIIFIKRIIIFDGNCYCNSSVPIIVWRSINH